MRTSVDEATGRFLETAKADLQRHLGSVGNVVALTIEPTGAEVQLDALVRVGQRTIVFSGSGESVVAAYGALVRSRSR
jgi:hypothetical protein